MSIRASSSRLCAVGLRVAGRTRPRLEDVHVELQQSELVAIVGENGSGKTTLLDHLGGVEEAPPDRGEVLLDQTSVSSLPAWERARTIASLDQHDSTNVQLAAMARIGQGLVPQRGARALLDDTARACIETVARELAIADKLEVALGGLSGGERRRVHLARALVDREASFVLVDEPHAGVDLRHREVVTRALRRRADDGAGVMFTTHDLTVAIAADRVVGLRAGRVVVQGAPAECLTPEALQELFGVALELDRSGARAALWSPLLPSSEVPSKLAERTGKRPA